jgi:hypothetical protein
MITKKYFTVILISLVLVSCSAKQVVTDEKQSESFYGEYSVYEKFEVHAGALTGQKGTVKYDITIVPGAKENQLIIEKFAKAYKVAATAKGDSIIIPSQKFPYHKGSVTIYGGGQLKEDTLFYNYFSGGSAGQILCECKAAKK